jgi:hypothetical protein
MGGMKQMGAAGKKLTAGISQEQIRALPKLLTTPPGKDSRCITPFEPKIFLPHHGRA